MKKKAYSGSAIRELARKKLKEQQEQERSSSRFGVSHRRYSEGSPASETDEMIEVIGEDVHRFSFGQFQEARGDQVMIVVPSEPDPYLLSENGAEIKRLCETLGLQCLEMVALNPRRKAAPATFLGAGTVEALGQRLKELGCVALVIDAALSPVQVRNMEKIIQLPVIDREGIILSIFQRHAHTSLAQIQVELAYLKYLQPRLAGLWSGLSRQRGAKGGLGGRGLGESRLELDRRVVKDRISALTKRLKQAEKSLDVQSARRMNLPRVALVGYTNAGKSSVMRYLTGADVEAKNVLFSTLDTTVRPLQPPTVPSVLVSDTVGFVRKLPHGLVASFKSTLKEAASSRVLLHVLDASARDWFEQFETTEEVLKELGMEQANRILVINKMDKLGPSFRMRYAEIIRNLGRHPNYVARVAVSAMTGEGMDVLRREIIRFCDVQVPEWSRS